MKKVSLALWILLISNQLLAQEIKVSPVYSIGSYARFKTSIGYGVGFGLVYDSGNKLEFTFSQSFNYSDYSYTHFSSSDGMEYYRDVIPHNQRTTFYSIYNFNVLKRKNFNLFFAPKLGLNYFKFDELITEQLAGANDTRTYNYNVSENNKIGFGASLECQKRILSDRLFLSFSAEHEIILLSNPLALGGGDSNLMSLLSLKLNVIFNLAKNKAPD